MELIGQAHSTSDGCKLARSLSLNELLRVLDTGQTEGTHEKPEYLSDRTGQSTVQGKQKAHTKHYNLDTQSAAP